jgi:hypothetical protein
VVRIHLGSSDGPMVWHRDDHNVLAKFVDSGVQIEHGAQLTCLKGTDWYVMLFDGNAQEFVFPETFRKRFPQHICSPMISV